MEKQKELIHIEGSFFIIVDEKLYDAETKEEEKKLRYKYVHNYFDKNIGYVIIKNRFFIWFKDKKAAQEYGVEMLCQNPRFTYYYTQGDINFVFAVKTNGEIFIIGRSFCPIYDNLYKIGRYAYQIINGELEKLCECMDFEKIDIRVEISAGEIGVSEMQAFQKVGNRWKMVTRWLPGHINPSSKK